jgi:hypothetical protein
MKKDIWCRVAYVLSWASRAVQREGPGGQDSRSTTSYSVTWGYHFVHWASVSSPGNCGNTTDLRAALRIAGHHVIWSPVQIELPIQALILITTVPAVKTLSSWKVSYIWVLVVHAWTLSYSGYGDQENHGSKTAQVNSSWDPTSKTLHKNRAGGVDQGEGPEFKPSVAKKKKKKERKKNKS